eukprot:4011369-Alexandrium_andersonii.AAC.1
MHLHCPRGAARGEPPLGIQPVPAPDSLRPQRSQDCCDHLHVPGWVTGPALVHLDASDPQLSSGICDPPMCEDL